MTARQVLVLACMFALVVGVAVEGVRDARKPSAEATWWIAAAVALSVTWALLLWRAGFWE